MALHSSGAAHFNLSDDGRLVVASVRGRALSRGKWVWVDRSGREEPVADPPGPHLYENAEMSPGGGILAMSLGGRYDRRGVWSYDLARHTLSSVAVGDDVMGSPLWTPDGRRVVFSSIRDASWGLYQKNADGTGEDEILITADDASRIVAVSWAGPNDDPTAALLAMKLGGNALGQQLEFQLLLLSLRDRTVQELPLDAAGLDASLSPDGEWLAYSSARSGQREIYIERFPALSDRLLVSNEGGEQPLWSNDGRELYYLDTDENRVMVVAVAISDSATGVDLAAPEVLVEHPMIAFASSDLGHSYDVSTPAPWPISLPGPCLEPKAHAFPSSLPMESGWGSSLTESSGRPLSPEALRQRSPRRPTGGARAGALRARSCSPRAILPVSSSCPTPGDTTPRHHPGFRGG